MSHHSQSGYCDESPVSAMNPWPGSESMYCTWQSAVTDHPIKKQKATTIRQVTSLVPAHRVSRECVAHSCRIVEYQEDEYTVNSLLKDLETNNPVNGSVTILTIAGGTVASEVLSNPPSKPLGAVLGFFRLHFTRGGSKCTRNVCDTSCFTRIRRPTPSTSHEKLSGRKCGATVLQEWWRPFRYCACTRRQEPHAYAIFGLIGRWS
ncbi:hypothetical protein EI94DRAFT_1696885 [Lactarius quietus]|nr:hypothetical protein EI94DRAFT_1696885 [Lactarius quietus]